WTGDGVPRPQLGSIIDRGLQRPRRREPDPPLVNGLQPCRSRLAGFVLSHSRQRRARAQPDIDDLDRIIVAVKAVELVVYGKEPRAKLLRAAELGQPVAAHAADRHRQLEILPDITHVQRHAYPALRRSYLLPREPRVRIPQQIFKDAANAVQIVFVQQDAGGADHVILQVGGDQALRT